jgi:glutamate formiminotransferase/formiminotetrahydrofolate cyclodeaminase
MIESGGTGNQSKGASMKPIVECVPNFSEGRRQEVIDAILSEITAVPGVTLLDYHADADHNRLVVTFVGEPEPVERAAFASIQKAAQLIDMDRHQGAHPRMGATDVVPFVPVAGVTMDECVAMARRVGVRVGSELGIPVYLYEAAAGRPDRVNLENVRRGQYEGLRAEIEANPDRKPDLGPARLGKAGATIIGARPFLIAFNVYLNTGNVEIAKAIARAVRQSNGGLRFVKGMGVLVDGQAQVSMNLTDFRQTPIARVVEFVRREATRYGASITRTELVGLAPQAALIDAAQWYLQLDDLRPDQILENRLVAGRSEPQSKESLSRKVETLSEAAQSDSLQAFLAATAAGTPAPGGGSVSALAGALAAALAAMVARLTVGKPKYADVESRLQDVIVQADSLCAKLTAAIKADNAAFDAVMAAMKLPKGTGEEKAARQAALQAATLHAAQVPLETVQLSLQALELALVVAQSGNVNSMTDAAVAGLMAHAAVEGAGLNVRVNVASLTDKAQARARLDELDTLRARAAQLADQAIAAAEQRGKIP